MFVTSAVRKIYTLAKTGITRMFEVIGLFGYLDCFVMLFGVIKRAIYHTFLNIIIDMIYDEAKYVSLCAHDFQKSLTNEIELPCK